MAILAQLGESIVLGVGLLFVASALTKLRHPVRFSRLVVSYEILPPMLAMVFGLLVIPLEAFIAIAFITGVWLDVAFPLACIALTAFLVAVVVNVHRGRDVPCGCLGDSEPISKRTVARLLILLPATALAYFVWLGDPQAMKSTFALAADPAGRLELLSIVIISGLLLAAGTWMLALPELLAATLPRRSGRRA